MMKETLLDFPLQIFDIKNEPKRLLLPHAHSKTDGSNSSSKYRRLGPKITETVKGKLKLGAKIIRAGGVAKIFRRAFGVGEGEDLLKASPCHLSTTAGPMAGILFISNYKIAFCSDRPIKLLNSMVEMVRFQYKVVIPLQKIKKVHESENVKRPSEKYLQIVTGHGFEFWFMVTCGLQENF